MATSHALFCSVPRYVCTRFWFLSQVRYSGRGGSAGKGSYLKRIRFGTMDSRIQGYVESSCGMLGRGGKRLVVKWPRWRHTLTC